MEMEDNDINKYSNLLSYHFFFDLVNRSLSASSENTENICAQIYAQKG